MSTNNILFQRKVVPKNDSSRFSVVQNEALYGTTEDRLKTFIAEFARCNIKISVDHESSVATFQAATGDKDVLDLAADTFTLVFCSKGQFQLTSSKPTALDIA